MAGGGVTNSSLLSLPESGRNGAGELRVSQGFPWSSDLREAGT